MPIFIVLQHGNCQGNCYIGSLHVAILPFQQDCKYVWRQVARSTKFDTVARNSGPSVSDSLRVTHVAHRNFEVFFSPSSAVEYRKLNCGSKPNSEFLSDADFLCYKPPATASMRRHDKVDTLYDNTSSDLA